MATLEPPLTLQAPQPVETVVADETPSMVPLETSALPGLDQMVASYAQGLIDADTASPAFSAKCDQVRTMGDDDIRRASSVANRLLEKSTKQMSKNTSKNANIGQTLLDLRRTIEDLDPSDAVGVKKFLGMVPFGDKLADYFRKYESSQKHLNAILASLYAGADELRRDNADLEVEKINLWQTMGRLKQYIYICEKLDATVAEKVAQLKITDPERAKTLEQDVLFYVRQKHQDLLTQLAVSVQGYLAIDIIRRNNIELIKGVDRATTTTISALRTAVIVAQALTNQKLVLDQITALNTTTSSLIESTSVLLREQSAGIQKQAASSTVNVEALKAAFANIYATMDELDSFRSASLSSMEQTVTVLSDEISKSQTYLARARREPGTFSLDTITVEEVEK